MAERSAPGRAPAALAVLAKAALPGFAKTRLVPRLGPDGACALHEVLVERTMRAARASGLRPVTLWCAPGRDHPLFERLARGGGVELRDQPEGDLGARMLAAFETHLRAGEPVVLVGTDAPALGPAHLARAAAALAAGADAALVPAEDGGYAALGLRRAAPSLFEAVPWGTAAVLGETRARLVRLGWSVDEQPAVRDVDLPADVDWLLASGLLSGDERARLAPYLDR